MALCIDGCNSTCFVCMLETPQLQEDGVRRLTSVSVLELDHFDAQESDLTDQQLRGVMFCGHVCISSEGESKAARSSWACRMSCMPISSMFEAGDGSAALDCFLEWLVAG
jgi:hypothetical protein